MEFNKAFEKIRKYLDSDSSSPIIVDLADRPSIVNLKNTFQTGSNEFIDSNSFGKFDTLPQTDKLLNELQNSKRNTFLMQISSYLKIEGEEKLKSTLRSLLDLNIEGKLVIVTFQCAEYLKFTDPRIEASGRIILVDSITGEEKKLPVLCFISHDFNKKYDAYVIGLNGFASIVESSENEMIYIETNKRKNDFPNSLYAIKENTSAFAVLSKISDGIANLGEETGSEELWRWLLNELENYDTWDDYLIQKYGGLQSLASQIGYVSTKTINEQWAYFLALKINGVQNNDYLSKIVIKSKTIEDFKDNIYTTILEYDHKSFAFQNAYKERKEVLKQFDLPINIRANFCKQVQSKQENAIYYLTDISIQEKELIIQLICQYANLYDVNSLKHILSIVYPDLNSYLGDYNYGQDELTKYFNSYKYNKLTNQIQEDFTKLVEKYERDRIYYTLLDRRSAIVAKMDKSNCKMYFVDALGVEFLNYIRESCYSKGLTFDANLAYCELPSITSFNKDFCNEFSGYVDVKELDELKHDGNGTYNYETTKLPIHIVKELEIIDKVLNNVEKDLHTNDIDRIFIISDHGASRLAVINEKENKWTVKEKGLHSGRCCPVSDLDEKPDFAVEDNGFWSIANYDRFQGGRKANVEVHGGATLEEVIVPIIEIKKAGEKPKCEICEGFKVIKVSFKLKARIQLFIAKLIDNVKVLCNGKYYDAKKTETKYVYDVEMPDVKKGHHTIDVFDGNTKIAEGLEFEAKSAGASENHFF